MSVQEALEKACELMLELRTGEVLELVSTEDTPRICDIEHGTFKEELTRVTLADVED